MLNKLMLDMMFSTVMRQILLVELFETENLIDPSLLKGYMGLAKFVESMLGEALSPYILVYNRADEKDAQATSCIFNRDEAIYVGRHIVRKNRIGMQFMSSEEQDLANLRKALKKVGIKNLDDSNFLSFEGGIF